LRTGDGFSRRAEDSILHGCIPVIIMDDVEEKFSTIVDYSNFSVRIAEQDIAKVSLHPPQAWPLSGTRHSKLRSTSLVLSQPVQMVLSCHVAMVSCG